MAGLSLVFLDPEIKPIALTPPGLVAGDIVHLDESPIASVSLGPTSHAPAASTVV